MHAVRGERRRREREQAAAAMQLSATKSETDRVIEQLEPAMDELDPADRDALVLRYLENRHLREVGAELGISEDAARMRANRALERLRGVLGRRGVSVTAVLLGTALVSGTSSAVPAGLAGAITTTALAATIVTTATITTMNWINLKAAAAVISAAVLAGTGTYLAKQNELNRLRVENQNLISQQSVLAAEHDSTLNAARSNNEELERLRRQTGELLRLRNEVGQLRREREEARQPVSGEITAMKSPSSPSAGTAANSITRDHLINAGYATPEAALQTITWASMSGTLEPEQVKEALAPQLLQDREAYAVFEENRKQSVAVFKSVDMLAKKTVDDSKVEFKVALNVDLGANGPNVAPSVMVLPITRIGNQWKLAGNPKDYTDTWDQDGQVQTFAR